MSTRRRVSSARPGRRALWRPGGVLVVALIATGAALFAMPAGAANQAPAFTSATTATFTVGKAGSFTVTASGTPAPTLSASGLLPGGVTFTPATGVLAGTPVSGTGKDYALTFSATNVAGTKTQTFTLAVDQPPSITSAASATFTTATPGAFSVTATGFPAPTFSESGKLPGGVSLNATSGALSGTPVAGTGGTYPLVITATNAAGPTTQDFTLTVDQPPAFTSASSVTSSVGAAVSFSAKASGFPAPTFGAEGNLPSGVSFAPSGSFAGTPAPGSQGSYPLTLIANNGVGTTASQAFTLTVNDAPVITSAASATFTVGAAGSFTVTAGGVPAPSFSEAGALPAGVTLTPATGVLAGTPGAGSGGSYSVVITASNGVSPAATQKFTLLVDQTPAITSAASATFKAGSSGTFTVKASGYPAPTFGLSGALPAGVSFNTATGVLSGTPSSGDEGQYPVTLSASNGIGADATQGLTIVVNQAPSITSAGGATFSVGNPNTFMISAGGYPSPTFSESGKLPSGVSFNAKSGVLSGTPPASARGIYAIVFTAQNGVSPNAVQDFVLTVSSAPPSKPFVGYDLAGTDGGVFVFGPSAPFFGSLPADHVHVNDIRGIVSSGDDRGYFLVGSDGGVFSFGDTTYEGSLPRLGVRLNDIVGIVRSSDSKGYFLVGSDGGVFTFGDARYEGSLPGEHVVVRNIVGIASTPSNQGYWVVGSDGSVHGFGDAVNYGSFDPAHNQIAGVSSTPTGHGYWLVDRTGGVYSFGDAQFFGSLPQLGVHPRQPIVSLVPTPDGQGYWLIAADGGVFSFGDAPSVGSLPGDHISVRNIIGAVAN